MTAGTVMIALGATIVAIGSGVGAGLHVVWLFSLSLAAGTIFMYAGFLRAGRRGRPPSDAVEVVRGGDRDRSGFGPSSRSYSSRVAT